MRWRAILIVLAAFPSSLKGELLPIRTYTIADGLASDRVHRIVADSRGFLWFCTEEGLSRFDGSHFVSYAVDERLPHQAVFTIREARSGDRWIGTARGISRIEGNGRGGRFTNYIVGQEAASVVALVESRSGYMWAATRTGLFEWNDPPRFRRLDVSWPVETRITTLAEDTGGHLWAGTTTGIFVLGESGVVQSFTAKDGLPGNWVEMLVQDTKGRVWAALRGGLVQFGLKADGRWGVEKIYSDDLADTDVKAVTEASDGTLWVGTARGISRLKWDGDGRPAIENISRAQGLSDRGITALAEDQAGNMWVGTESAGVMRIGRLGFTTYREQDGLHSDRVWSVLEGRSGELLAVTIPQEIQRARSVDVLVGARFHSMAPGRFADDPNWGWNQVLLQSRTGEWWAATAHGLCRFGAVKAADLDGRRPRACYAADARIFSIFEDSKGGIWASAQSGQGDRLMRWNPQTQAVFLFPYPRVPGEQHGELPDDLVGAFTEDRQGNVWMGLYKGGLYRYNGREFQLLQQKDGVPAGPILALLATGSGVWIGSEGGGLGRIENTGDLHPRVKVYDTAYGMSSDIIECLVEDRAGRIYAGTGKGVDRLDPGSEHIRHFSIADGLAHGEFHGAVRDRSGSLWFATTQGLSRLIPTADSKPPKPLVLITDVRIGGAAYAVSQLGETRIVVPELKPSQNQLQVEFVGIDYEAGDLVRYSTKLEGADSSWSTPRNQKNISYAALAEGRYRFLVKAVTSDGVESAAPAEIDFTVLPPVWKRWWFMSLSAALAIALVLAMHRYRVAQMVGLERMRTSIATDLHDDIGASLSQIAILSEVARIGGSGKSSEPLERVATLARELVDSMGDIVWSIRSEPHGMDSLIRHMREFALDLLASQGISFQLRTPQSADTVQLSLEVRRQLFLMFKECIHNVARHSRCTAVVAELKAGHREVVLTVEDNGLGFNPGEKAPGAGGTGIPGMRTRTESLGGRLQVTSSCGHGCRVEIRLPARRSAFVRTAS